MSFLYRYRNNDSIDRHVGGAGFNSDAGDVGEPSDPNDRDEFDPMMESDFDPDDFDMSQADDHIAKMADHIERLHEMGKIDVHRVLAESLFHDEQQTHSEGAFSRERVHHMVRKAMKR